MGQSSIPFGPFWNGNADDVEPARFDCHRCKHPVRKCYQYLGDDSDDLDDLYKPDNWRVLFACNCGYAILVCNYERDRERIPRNREEWEAITGKIHQLAAKAMIFTKDHDVPYTGADFN